MKIYPKPIIDKHTWEHGFEAIDAPKEKVYFPRIILLPVKCTVQIVEQKYVVREISREYGKKIILRQGR